MRSRSLLGVALLLGAAHFDTAQAQALELPPHEPLDIVILSDRVNPHGLSAADLTEPGDISATLQNPASGIAVGVVQEVASDCADDALTMLENDEPDVFIYFAHRAALACDGSAVQERLVDDVTAHLERGGGVVVFHHGVYQEPPGKDAILRLFGISASGIAWDTSNGQTVIDTAPGHFVTTNGLEYEGETPFELPAAGVPQGDYGFFSNVPDESYPNTTLLVEDGEDRTILFATSSGAPRVLGYDLRRPGWNGRVIAYQPGEYQPNALDDLAGNNFQILANAIYYVGVTQEVTDPGNGGSGGFGGSVPVIASAGSPNGGASTGGSSEAGGSSDVPQAGAAGQPGEPDGGSPSSGGSTNGRPAPAGVPTDGGGGPNAPSPGDPTPSSGGATSVASPDSSNAPSPAEPGGGRTSGNPPEDASGGGEAAETTEPEAATSSSGDDEGCGCRVVGESRSPPFGFVAFGALGVAFAVVRRRSLRARWLRVER